MTATRRLPAFGKSPRRQPPLAATPAEPLYLVTYDYRDRAIGRCTGTADLSLNQQSRREVAEQIARGLIPGAAGVRVRAWRALHRHFRGRRPRRHGPSAATVRAARRRPARFPRASSRLPVGRRGAPGVRRMKCDAAHWKALAEDAESKRRDATGEAHRPPPSSNPIPDLFGLMLSGRSHHCAARDRQVACRSLVR